MLCSAGERDLSPWRTRPTPPRAARQAPDRRSRNGPAGIACCPADSPMRTRPESPRPARLAPGSPPRSRPARIARCLADCAIRVLGELGQQLRGPPDELWTAHFAAGRQGPARCQADSRPDSLATRLRISQPTRRTLRQHVPQQAGNARDQLPCPKDRSIGTPGDSASAASTANPELPIAHQGGRAQHADQRTNRS